MRFTLLAAFCFAAPLAAQQPSTPAGPPPQPPFTSDSGAVMQVVRNLFTGMRTRDTTLMRAQFHSSATMRSAGWQRTPAGPQPMITEDAVSEWVGSIPTAAVGKLLDERLGPPQVHVDGNLAMVWAYYEFYLDDQFSHCGADQFTLARASDGWKIVFVSDSRRRTGCAQSLPTGS